MATRIQLALAYEAHLIGKGKIKPTLAGTTRKDRAELATLKGEQAYAREMAKPLWGRTEFTTEDFTAVVTTRNSKELQLNDFNNSRDKRGHAKKLSQALADYHFKNRYVKLTHDGIEVRARFKPNPEVFEFDYASKTWTIKSDALETLTAIKGNDINLGYSSVFYCSLYSVESERIRNSLIGLTLRTLSTMVVESTDEYITLAARIDLRNIKSYERLVLACTIHQSVGDNIKVTPLFETVSVPADEMPLSDFIECLMGTDYYTAWKCYNVPNLISDTATANEKSDLKEQRKAELLRKLF